jgi:hypothetical protein
MSKILTQEQAKVLYYAMRDASRLGLLGCEFNLASDVDVKLHPHGGAVSVTPFTYGAVTERYKTLTDFAEAYSLDQF